MELAALFCEAGADENVGAPVRFLRKDGCGQKCPRSNVPETNLPPEGCREKAALAPRRSGNSPAGCSVSTIPLLSESRVLGSKLKERATQTGIIVTIPHTDASFIFKKAEWSADIFVRHRAQSCERSAEEESLQPVEKLCSDPAMRTSVTVVVMGRICRNTASATNLQNRGINLGYLRSSRLEQEGFDWQGDSLNILRQRIRAVAL